MSRARDMANLGAQAGSGFDASDLTTGTLGNTVQDNITRLGTVTTGTMNNTIGSSATFPDGMVTNTIVRKYVLGTNTSYGNSTADHKIFSRQSDSSATVSSFTAKQGYTYLINMVYYGIGERSSGTTSGRSFTTRMYYGTASRSQGNTTFDTMLCEGSFGRNMTSAASSGSQTSFTLINMVGSFYHSSADSTIYYYGTSYIGDTSKIVRVYMSSLFPGYDIIHEIKGNKLTTES